MCTNAVKTAADLMLAMEPDIKSILTEAHLINTPAGQTVLTEYVNALEAVQNWKSGTPAQDVIEIIGDFQTAFNALPLPPTVQIFTNLILGGIETVIGILTANSPAPVGTEAETAGADTTPEEVKAAYQAHVIQVTAARVKLLVPTFKQSRWHSAASQYKKAVAQAKKIMSGTSSEVPAVEQVVVESSPAKPAIPAELLNPSE